MKSFTVVAFAAARATAQLVEVDGTGPMIRIGGSIPRGLDNQTADMVTDAVTRPNATRSAAFQPFSGKLTGDPGTDWTWRINVTDIALPHLEGRLKGEVENVTDPHLVSTSFDLQWPGGGNLSNILSSPKDAFCVTVLDRREYPANVTDLYTEEISNSASCEPVLGPDCVAAIVKESNSKSSTKCVEPETPWERMPECRESLGRGPRGSIMYSTFDINGKVYLNGLEDGVKNTSRLGGEAFYGLSTGVVDGSEAAGTYLEATDQLHIMMVGYTDKDTTSTELLCMRVKASSASDDATSGSGGPTSGDSGNATTTGSGDTSAAVSGAHLGWSLVIVSGVLSLALW